MNYFNGSDWIEVNGLDRLLNLSQEDANNLASGPQDIFFERLQSINDEMAYYDCGDIDVTNKWNWKPGSYDKMKEYVYKRLDLHKKARNMSNVVDRTMDKSNYLRYIQRRIQTMEFERANLKHLGVSKNVDINKFIDTCKVFVENVLEQCKEIAEMTDGKVLICPYIDSHSDRNISLYYDIMLVNLTLGIFSGRKNPKNIQNIPLNPINIVIRQSLRHKLSNTICDFKALGLYQDGKGVKHNFVYISHSYGNSEHYGTVCLDKHHDDIRKSLRKNDLKALSMHLLNWAQYYNLQIANPYNQPTQLHIGMPKDYSNEYKSHFDDKTISSDCADRLYKFHHKMHINNLEQDESIHKICNNSNCSLQDMCSTNKHILRRNNVLDSEFGYLSEAVTQLIVGHLEDYCSKDDLYNEGKVSQLSQRYIKTNISNCTACDIHSSIGLLPKTESDEDLIYDVELLLIEARQIIFFYLINEGRIDSYMHNYLENNNLIELGDVENKIMSEDELETIMKQWAATQGGR